MAGVKQRVAAVSVVASGAMAALKFAVGVAIGSIALVSEALHSLVDFGATIVTWLVVRVSDKPADAEHHYGHGKFESLSALGVVALLYILAGGILVESYSRLRAGAVPPTISAIPFVVLLIDIAVNLWRARALHQAAHDTHSQALEADALHFSSDVLGSFAVIVGLALSAAGFHWGDAAGAIAVAIAISFLGLRLARATVETLLDRAPEGVADQAAAVIRRVPGVIGIERIRARTVGPTHFIEAAVNVPRTYPIDRVEDIKRAAQTAVKSTLADSDLTFTAVPTVLDNETVRERIMVIARNAGLAIHHVTVHDLDNKLAVSIDLEVEADMALERAHDITHRLEDAIKAEFGDHIEIDIHIEPLEPELPRGGDATAERIDAVQCALNRIAASLGTMHDVHNVRVRNTGAGQIVNFHCRTRPDLRVSQVHAAVDDIERALRREFADIKRVIGHAEPDR